MGWAFVWMFVVLKIPVVAALWLVWWAVREEKPIDEPRDGGGSDRERPDHPRRPRPRPPRRGPHAEPPPRPPRRVRAHARARPHERLHSRLTTGPLR
jgi:hypothetical protein